MLITYLEKYGFGMQQLIATTGFAIFCWTGHNAIDGVAGIYNLVGVRGVVLPVDTIAIVNSCRCHLRPCPSLGFVATRLVALWLVA